MSNACDLTKPNSALGSDSCGRVKQPLCNGLLKHWTDLELHIDQLYGINSDMIGF